MSVGNQTLFNEQATDSLVTFLNVTPDRITNLQSVPGSIVLNFLLQESTNSSQPDASALSTSLQTAVNSGTFALSAGGNSYTANAVCLLI
jgi:hypothetical protein